MQQFQRILVGIEPAFDPQSTTRITQGSDDALMQAIWLAQQNNAVLQIACVVECDESEPPSCDSRVAMEVRSLVEALHQRCDEAEVTSETHVLFGRPWLELIRQALRSSSHLVVVGTCGERSIRKWFCGTTALKLIRHCPGPVWVTKGPIDHDETPDVMVASDLTPVAENAIHLAVQAALVMDARLHVLHSIENFTQLRLKYSDVPDDEVEAAHEKELRRAESELHNQLSMTDHRTLTWGARIDVVDGPAHRQIIKAVNEHNIELLVIGTVARGGIPGLLIGNTAERLLSEVQCSLLTVKPDDFVCEVTLDD